MIAQMEVILEFDYGSRILRATVKGEMTDEGGGELYSCVQRFLKSEEVRGGILDLSEVTKLEVSAPAVVRLSKNPPLFGGSEIRVIVAPQDLTYGMARMFQISRSEIHGGLHVVHTSQEAYRILKLDKPEFKRVGP